MQLAQGSADPILRGALRQTVLAGGWEMGGCNEGMDQTHLCVFYRARGKRSRDFMIFTLHEFTDFCVERVITTLK